MYETDPLARILFGISTGCMVYAIIRLILLGVHLDEGGQNMNLLLGVSDGVWSAAGAAIASLITVGGTLLIQKRKERQNVENIKNRIDNTTDNVKDVNTNVKDVAKRIEFTKDKMTDKVIIPVKSILEKSIETKTGVDYLVLQQKINEKIKQEAKSENASQLAKAYVDKLSDEILSDKEQISELKQEIFNINNEKSDLEKHINKLENEKNNLKDYISELKDERNRLIRQLNKYERKEQIQSNDEFEL